MNGDDEVEAGENRGEAIDEDTDDRGSDGRIRVNAAEWRVKRPAGVEPASAKRIQDEAAANDVDVPAEQIDLREGQILRADHQGNQEIPKDRGDRRDQEEENHRHAVHGEKFVVRFGGDQGSGRRQKMDANHGGEDAANEKENSDRTEIQQGDALVIGGQ